MDIYSQIKDYVINLPVLREWAEARALFTRIASGEQPHWLMPAWACESVGGTGEDALPACAAIACAHVGIILVDDMLDSDPRGEYHRIGAAASANLACAFQAASLASFAGAHIPNNARLAAMEGMNAMFLSTALGQFWDVQTPNDEAAYWLVTQTKSSPFFGAALQIGALAGGAPVETSNRLKELGKIYGEIIQIHDDLEDSLAVPANSDWILGRAPLPILFAKLVDHPDRTRFLELCAKIESPGALEEAQEILIRCGAVAYCVEQLHRRDESARALLDATPLTRREILDGLFARAIAPVWKLLEALEDESTNAPAFRA